MTGARRVRPEHRRVRTHARLLQAILTRRHWTHQQLADEIGVTRVTLSRWLNDHRDPHVAWMKIIRALHERDAAN